MAKLFRVWWTESDEGSGDRNEIARVRANSLDEAVKFARLKFLKHPFSGRFWDEDGDDKQAFVLHHTAHRTEGLEVDEEDIKPGYEKYLPPWSPSDVFDLTKPESIGMPLPRLKRFVLTKSVQVPKMKTPRVRY